jgi:hypothetical protein
MSDDPVTTPIRGPRKVFAAISALTAELAKVGIAKDRKNTDQKYSFRGIDDVYNVLAPLLAKHKLVILPNVVDRKERVAESKSGGKLNYVVLTVQYSFISVEDDSFFIAQSIGEGMDSSDKATNKAFSAAYKYAVIQAFAIPVEGTPDADEEDPTTQDDPGALDKVDIEALAARIKASGMSQAKLLKHFEAAQLNELNKTQLKDLNVILTEREAKNANPSKG